MSPTDLSRLIGVSFTIRAFRPKSLVPTKHKFLCYLIFAEHVRVFKIGEKNIKSFVIFALFRVSIVKCLFDNEIKLHAVKLASRENPNELNAIVGLSYH